jgi:hypothetical protein
VGQSLSESGSATESDTAILPGNMAKQLDKGRDACSQAEPEWSYETTSIGFIENFNFVTYTINNILFNTLGSIVVYSIAHKSIFIKIN